MTNCSHENCKFHLYEHWWAGEVMAKWLSHYRCQDCPFVMDKLIHNYINKYDDEMLTAKERSSCLTYCAEKFNSVTHMAKYFSDRYRPRYYQITNEDGWQVLVEEKASIKEHRYKLAIDNNRWLAGQYVEIINKILKEELEHVTT